MSDGISDHLKFQMHVYQHECLDPVMQDCAITNMRVSTYNDFSPVFYFLSIKFCLPLSKIVT